MNCHEIWIKEESLTLSEVDLKKEGIPIIVHNAQIVGQLSEIESYMNKDQTSTVIVANEVENNHNVTSWGSLDLAGLGIMTPIEPTTVEMMEESQEEQSVNLWSLLNSTNDGKALLAEYKSTGELTGRGRRTLCKLVINKELGRNPQKRIPNSRLQTLANEITRVFPKEYTSMYFIPYSSFGPGLKRSAKGKLVDYLNNIKRIYRKSGLIESMHGSSSSSIAKSQSLSVDIRSQALNNLPEVEADEEIMWLRNCTDPWARVEAYWDLSRKTRIKKIMCKEGKSIDEYFAFFPCLRKPAGYHLLLKDFDILYPKHTNNLFKNLPLYRGKLLEVAKKRARISKSEDVRERIESLLDLAQGGAEQASIAALLCIPYVLALTTMRTRKKDAWRPSRSEASDGFITHIHKTAELGDTVKRRSEKMKQLNVPFLPFVVAVGPSLAKLECYYVIVNNVFYKLSSITTAVDACFKIIQVLNAPYPTESTAIWSFIQKGFYGVVKNSDTVYTNVNTLLSEIGFCEKVAE